MRVDEPANLPTDHKETQPMGFRRIDVVLINVTPYTVTSAGLDITNSGVTNVLTPPRLDPRVR